MSCAECEKMQNSDLTAYYRWKEANIEMRGCEKHLREIIETLNKAQKEAEESK